MCFLIVSSCIIVIVTLVQVFGVKKDDVKKQKNYLLLISFDGFRHDYLDLFSQTNSYPNLLKMMETGTYVSHMLPTFPSKTFPNHYSIVTGLYTESHGIVANRMFDPVFNATFELGNEEAQNGRWWDGEPIWVTAELQNVTTGCVFWPGSDVPIKGIYPTYYKKYSREFTYKDRINLLFEYLDKDESERPQFMTMYFESVDDAGHEFGPNSKEVADSIKEVDDLLGEILTGIEKRGLMNQTDIIIVSDHGMSSVDGSRVIYLDDYIGEHMNDIQFYDLKNHGCTAMIHVKDPSKVDIIYNKLLNATSLESMRVYKRDNMPQRFHFKNNRRIPEIIVVAEQEWLVSTRESIRLKPVTLKGTHGYDNRAPDMGSIFIARGPSFRKGYINTAFENIQLYNVMAKILGIVPAPNNGTLDDVLFLLSPEFIKKM
jgi:predicted AlkP superfamily pyrophosphatase or phosphodiesterase